MAFVAFVVFLVFWICGICGIKIEAMRHPNPSDNRGPEDRATHQQGRAGHSPGSQIVAYAS